MLYGCPLVVCENMRWVRGTNNEEDDGEGTGEVMSSSSGVSLIPITM